MDPLLRNAGKIATLRHAVNRWIEYAIFMGFLAVAALGLGKWQSWPLLPLVSFLVVLAVIALGVAGHFTIQLLATETNSRRIERARAARRRA